MFRGRLGLGEFVYGIHNERTVGEGLHLELLYGEAPKKEPPEF